MGIKSKPYLTTYVLYVLLLPSKTFDTHYGSNYT